MIKYFIVVFGKLCKHCIGSHQDVLSASLSVT